MCFIFQVIEIAILSHKWNEQFGLKPPSHVFKARSDSWKSRPLQGFWPHWGKSENCAHWIGGFLQYIFVDGNKLRSKQVTRL